MAPSESFLDRLTVTPAADGLVAVTVLLAPELVRDYCRFLETLASFFSSVDRKAKAQRLSITASTQAAQKESGILRRAEYRARLVASFDAYTLWQSCPVQEPGEAQFRKRTLPDERRSGA